MTTIFVLLLTQLLVYAQPVLSPPPEYVFTDPNVSEKSLQEMKAFFDTPLERVPESFKQENKLNFVVIVYTKKGRNPAPKIWGAASMDILRFLAKTYELNPEEDFRIWYRPFDEQHTQTCIAVEALLVPRN
jgi:hypothetical protein